MVCYDRTIFENLEQKNLNIEKIIFKVVQMKFLAMHITNQKLSFYIFTEGNVQNIFMEHELLVCLHIMHTVFIQLIFINYSPF